MHTRSPPRVTIMPNEPQNRGTQGGQDVGGKTGAGGGQKFVGRFEMAVMQFVILSKAKQGGVTKENLQQIFKGNLQMKGEHLDHCLRELVSEEHLRQEGNRYVITDDGREDVQQIQHLVIELPSYVDGQQQKAGMQATQTAGGQRGGNVQGNYGGQTTGTQPNVGTSGRGDVGSTQQGTYNQGSTTKGGATGIGQQGGSRREER